MKHIVIIDDDLAIQRALKIVFDPAIYRISIYENAAPILNNEFDIPDLIILDRQLPGQDGLEICRFLKDQEKTRRIPIIIISADSEIHSLAKEAGAESALEKPFRLEELRRMVNKYTSEQHYQD